MAIYVHKSLKYRRIDISNIVGAENTPKESITLEIQLLNGELMLFTNIYRSPNSTVKDNERINEFFRKTAETKGHQHKVIVGDFNRKGINWENITAESRGDIKIY